MITNITDYRNVGDWFYLVTAVIVVDLIVIFLAKYPGRDPYFKVNALDKWYKDFGILAVGSDVGSILIGIAATRYIYTLGGFKGIFAFLAVLLLFQLFHDVLFFVGVIQPMPSGHNAMIDVFKAYAKENGAAILVADGLMMVASVVLGSLLKSSSDHVTISVMLLSLYMLTYVLYTRTPVTV